MHTRTHTFRSPAFPAFLLVPVLCSEPPSLYLVKWPLRHLRWEPWSPVPICLQTLPGGDTRIFPPSGFLLECLGQGLRPRYLLCFTIRNCVFTNFPPLALLASVPSQRVSRPPRVGRCRAIRPENQTGSHQHAGTAEGNLQSCKRRDG